MYIVKNHPIIELLLTRLGSGNMSFVWSESDLLWRQWCTLRQERRRRRRRRKMKIVHLQTDEEDEDRLGGVSGVRGQLKEEEDKIGKDV